MLRTLSNNFTDLIASSVLDELKFFTAKRVSLPSRGGLFDLPIEFNKPLLTLSTE